MLHRRRERDAARLTISFHVGSQCLERGAYARAIARSEVIVDVGGGFPAGYPNMAPPALGDCVAAIASAAAKLGRTVRLWAEPGRPLSPAAARSSRMCSCTAAMPST